MAEVVYRILERGPPVAAENVGAVALPGARRARRIDLFSPSPQAASVAVMGMLGFGVILGDVSGAGIVTLASTPGISINLPPGFGSNPNPPSTPLATAPSRPPVASTSGSTPAATQPATTATTPVSTGSTGTTGAGTTPGTLTLPPVKHVFLIVLSNQGVNQTFTPVSSDKYLSKTLPAAGELLQNYYSVNGGSLANEIALVSGQGPTQQTQANCPKYKPFKHGKHQQIVGSGCVYPKTAPTLAGQLLAQHHTWKSYIEGLQNGPRSQQASCGLPKLGKTDPYNAPRAKDPYVTWRNPFAYFASLTGKSTCRKTNVPLTALTTDLKSESTTPSLSYIVASPCDDGDPTPCAKHAEAGTAPADAFLKRTLALIEASPAYKSSGLIAITFDHAQQTGRHADPSACCTTPPYPNLSTGTTGTTGTTGSTGTTGTTGATGATGPTSPYGLSGLTGSGATGTTSSGATGTTSCSTSTGTSGATGATSTTGASGNTGATGSTGSCGATTPIPGGLLGGQTTPTGGGGQVGLLLISKYVKGGTIDTLDYFNHFSLLNGIEALFKLKPLGYAADPALPRFVDTIYNGGR
jgi:hypothetical protein